MILSVIKAGGGGFWAPIADPLAAVLAFFYGLVPNYGVAIFLLTVAMMIVLTPLTIKQTRSMLVMQKLQPEMKKLQELHKNDRQALNEAIMALYKEHNASPLGGCLPMLLPFPLFIALLRVLEGLSRVFHQGSGKSATTTSIPKYLASGTQMYRDIVKAGGKLDAFGMDLAKSARSAGGGFGHSLPYFVLLLLMVGTQFYQQYQLTSKNPAMKSQPGQAMMMKLIPVIFGVISLAFPAGVVLYWTVSNIIRIGQQWALYRYDPKVKALVAQDVKEVEAKTREIDAAEGKPRPRFRDLLNNASSAAADRRGATPKGDRPGAKPGGDKGGATGRGSGAGVAKSKRAGPQNAPKTGGTQKGVAPKPGPSKPSPAKGTPARGTPAKAGAPKGAAPKMPAKPGAPRPGSTKPAGPKPGPAKPGGTKTPAAGAGAGAPGPASPASPKGDGPRPAAGGPTTPDATPTPSVKPVAAQAPAEGQDAPTLAPEAALPTNGSGLAAVAGTTVSNGAGKTSANGDNGTAEGVDDVVAAVDANSGPARTGGRTGGGSARTVSSRRRRKGR